MGCAQSKIEIEISNKDSVCRCRDSLHLLKEVITARKALASALSSYARTLKNTGSAFIDYAHGEAAEAPSQIMPPPPPPLPSFSLTPLQRSVSMPVIPVAKKGGRKINNGAILEEDEDKEEDEEEEDREHDLSLRKGRKSRGRMATVDKTPSTMAPPPMPESKGMAWDYFFGTDSMRPTNLSEEDDDNDDYIHEEVNGGGGGIVVGSSSVNLLKILGEIDDHFLKASESAQEVCKMLDAARLHYHSNFIDNRGHIKHAARVKRVITLNRSFKGVLGENGNDEYNEDTYETLATVLDRLFLALEKKLYEEVKDGELMKLEYQRKVALLNKLRKRSASTESLEKTKAAVSQLHTRYIVHMQSLDSTLSEVNDLRDEYLFPKLVALVDRMSNMWHSMCVHHDNQLTIVSDLKSLDVSGAPKETTKHHYETTIQLYLMVQEWHSHFETLVTHQKHYVQALDKWLKLNLIPIKSSLKEIISSPPGFQIPPIQTLIHSRQDHLQKLPDELAKSAIFSFAAAIETILNHQEEEMKLKDKCEETRKKYMRKARAFEDWYHEYMMRRGPQEETVVTGTDPKDPIAERRFVVESLKKRLEDETEAHQKLCVQVRDKSLASLKTRLPELFRALSDYAHVCQDSYQRLRLIMHSKNCQNRS